MLRIGTFTATSNLVLAPIAGFTDLAFRLCVRDAAGQSVGLCHTDLVNPRGLMRGSGGALQLVQTCPQDRPLGIQLYGADADELAEAAQWCCTFRQPNTMDINMGCPVDKVAKKTGAGAMLLCDLHGTVRLAAKVVEAVGRTAPHVPVTAKIRLGWDASCIVAPELAERLADAGVAMVTVHGRTAVQRFEGKADWTGIARVVEAVKRRHPGVPILGNGDVKTPLDAQRMLRETGCDGVMIGRAALSDPWIFPRTDHYLKTGELLPPVSRPERWRVVKSHFERMVEYRGAQTAIGIFRQRVAWYKTVLGPSKPFREIVRKMNALSDWQRAVETFESSLAEERTIGLERNYAEVPAGSL